MSDRMFSCACQKCGTNFDFTGTYEDFNHFMSSENFACPGGHAETRSPRAFLKVLKMSDPQPIPDWKPKEGRNYVDILDLQMARINGMQIEHLGSGLYIDRRTRRKYDYEEDSRRNRHYFEVKA